MANLAELNVVIGAKLDEFDHGLRSASQKLDRLDKDVKNTGRSVGGFSSVVKGGIGVLAGFASIDFAAQLGGKIIDTTSQFQKLNAVLANTLGSQQKGQVAFAGLQDFASKTNFSVLELTDTFVKLTNSGFKPSTRELTSLADLANSTGKSFDMLTEAIIDAQTGEFERLKEFGIRASKEGDKVKFTFKGVETQVGFTADSIKNYITGLGNLEGVSGSTAAISETLGGKISNLGDAFDNLFNTIGGKGNGVMGGFIALLTEGVSSIEQLIAGEQEMIRRQALKELADQGENFGQTIDQVAQNYIRAGKSAEEARTLSEQWLKGEALDNVKKYQDEIDSLDKKIKQLTSQTGMVGQVTDVLGIGNLDQAKKDQEAAKGQLAKFKQQLDILNKTGEFAIKVPIKVGDSEKLQEQQKALKKIADTISDVNARLAAANSKEATFGDQFDLGAERVKILKAGIDSLLEQGLKPSSAEVQRMVGLWKEAAKWVAFANVQPLKMPALEQNATKAKEDALFSGKVLTPKVDINPLIGYQQALQLTAGQTDVLAQAAARLGVPVLQLGREFEASGMGMQQFIDKKDVLLQVNQQIGDSLRQLGATAAAGFGEMIGSMITGQQESKRAVEKLFGSIAASAAGAMISIGSTMLLAGATAPQGIALITAGGLLKGIASSLGGSGGGGSRGGSGGRAATPDAFSGIKSGLSIEADPAVKQASKDSFQASKNVFSGSENLTVTLNGRVRLEDEGGALYLYIEKQKEKFRRTSG